MKQNKKMIFFAAIITMLMKLDEKKTFNYKNDNKNKMKTTKKRDD